MYGFRVFMEIFSDILHLFAAYSLETSIYTVPGADTFTYQVGRKLCSQLFIEFSYTGSSAISHFKLVIHATCLRRGPSDGVHHSHRHQSGGLLPLLPHPQTGPWTHPLWCDRVAATGRTVGFHGQPQVSELRIPMSPGKTWDSVSRVCFARFMKESWVV